MEVFMMRRIKMSALGAFIRVLFLSEFYSDDSTGKDENFAIHLRRDDEMLLHSLPVFLT